MSSVLFVILSSFTIFMFLAILLIKYNIIQLRTDATLVPTNQVKG